MNKLEQMIRKIAAEEAQTAINNFLGDMLSEETPKTESKSKPKPKPKNKAKSKNKKPKSNGRVTVNLDGWSYVAGNVEPGPAGVKCRSLGYGITYTGDDFMVNFFIAIMSLGPWTKQDGFSALAIKTEMQKVLAPLGRSQSLPIGMSDAIGIDDADAAERLQIKYVC